MSFNQGPRLSLAVHVLSMNQLGKVVEFVYMVLALYIMYLPDKLRIKLTIVLKAELDEVNRNADLEPLDNSERMIVYLQSVLHLYNV
jgi:hypothetical protein